MPSLRLPFGGRSGTPRLRQTRGASRAEAVPRASGKQSGDHGLHRGAPARRAHLWAEIT